VHNAGVNGQEAPDEAARFKDEVLALKPALVIWQVGTNAAWKDYFLDDVGAAIVCTENLIRVDDVMESPKLAG
jgi:acyl-CoA thioesterase I